MQGEAIADGDGLGGNGRPAGLGEGLARWMAVALVASWITAAVLLGWRRLAGALATPLGWPALGLAGLWAAGLAALARLGWATGGRRPGRILLPALLSIAVVLWAAALSLPGSSPVGLALLWVGLVVEELLAWVPPPRGSLSLFRPARWPGRAALSVEPVEPPRSAPPVSIGGIESPPHRGVTQQLIRSGQLGGEERMAGWVRICFAVRQRSASVHLAFCPPFARTPRVWVERSEGPAVRIRVVQVLAYGARVDLKLGLPADRPLEVMLHFVAETGPLGSPPASPAGGSSASGGPARANRAAAPE